jgi:hypothetical protein
MTVWSRRRRGFCGFLVEIGPAHNENNIVQEIPVNNSPSHSSGGKLLVESHVELVTQRDTHINNWQDISISVVRDQLDIRESLITTTQEGLI